MLERERIKRYFHNSAWCNLWDGLLMGQYTTICVKNNDEESWKKTLKMFWKGKEQGVPQLPYWCVHAMAWLFTLNKNWEKTTVCTEKPVPSLRILFFIVTRRPRKTWSPLLQSSPPYRNTGKSCKLSYSDKTVQLSPRWKGHSICLSIGTWICFCQMI